jgi:hypothetical protein
MLVATAAVDVVELLLFLFLVQHLLAVAVAEAEMALEH